VSDTVIIVNPASSGGGTGRRWPKIADRLSSSGLDFEVKMTSRPQQAVEIARREVQASRPLVVAAGGDGTINEVVNGFFQSGRPLPTSSRLGILPLGTGGDYRRTFSLPAEPEGAVQALLRGIPRRIDAGLATFRGHDGSQVTRHFINIADAGVGGDVVDRVNRSRKRLGGDATFMLAALVASARWKNKPMQVTIDDLVRNLVAQQVVIANGQYFGSGMRIAPMAQPDDGFFDVILVGDVSMVENLRGLSKIKAGRHLEEANSKLELFRGKRVAVESPEPVRIDLDGEQPGFLPASFEIEPAAIELMTPPV
jgi:YegS/Rv2252/BmrU family lipid kinase